MNIFDTLGEGFPKIGTLFHDGVIKLISFSQKFFDGLNSFFGPNLPLLKTISLALIIIFLYGIFWTLTRSGYAAYRTDLILDFWRVGDVFKRRSLRAWSKIKSLARGKDPEDWKRALFKTEELLDIILKQSGFKGAGLEERLNSLNIEQLTNLQEVKRAHIIAERFRNNPEFEISQEEVESLLDIYKEAFQELHLLD